MKPICVLGKPGRSSKHDLIVWATTYNRHILIGRHWKIETQKNGIPNYTERT